MAEHTMSSITIEAPPEQVMAVISEKKSMFRRANAL